MPLQALKFQPGVRRNATTLSNEGAWFECDKVRFRGGLPEKIGGWTKDSGPLDATLTPPTGRFWGVCRSLWNWITLKGNNLLGLGTNLKFYIQDSTDGYLYDITPLRATFTSTDTDNCFTATDGSSVINVNIVGHNAQTGDFVTFSGAAGLGGNITAGILNAEHQVTYVDSNNFTITVSTTANATDAAGSPGGGTAIDATFQLNSGNDVGVSLNGFGAGTWGGSVTGTTVNTLNGALNDSDTTITVTSTAGFDASGTIIIDYELITYTGKTTSPDTFTGCTRGALGTSAASHSSGATVTQVTSDWTGWGQSSSVALVSAPLRLWSQINFGERLIFNPRGGALYLWVPSSATATYTRAQILSSTNTNTQEGVAYWTTDTSCPSKCNIVHVSDSSRFVIAFGCNDYFDTTLNPLLVRWSDQEDYATWTPAVTNQAGSFTLSAGSEIVAIKPQRQEILVFTDAAVYSMQYLGAPYVWGFQQIGANISIVGPNAVTTAANLTFWMGEDKFYYYDGRVNTLPCPLWQWVFYNINKNQHSQVFATTNEGFDEIWWFYCSEGSNTIDRYVVFNYTDKIWYYGNLDRTAWLDTPLRNNPVATGYAGTNGDLYSHESGVDADGSAMTAYITSADFDLADGYQFQYGWRMIPDVKFDGSTTAAPQVTVSLTPRQYPGSNYGTAETGDVVSANNYTTTRQYEVQRFTDQLPIRVRGRQMAFKIESNTLGTQWQLGVPRINLKPDGRR